MGDSKKGISVKDVAGMQIPRLRKAIIGILFSRLIGGVLYNKPSMETPFFWAGPLLLRPWRVIERCSIEMQLHPMGSRQAGWSIWNWVLDRRPGIPKWWVTVRAPLSNPHSQVIEHFQTCIFVDLVLYGQVIAGLVFCLVKSGLIWLCFPR